MNYLNIIFRCQHSAPSDSTFVMSLMAITQADAEKLQ